MGYISYVVYNTAVTAVEKKFSTYNPDTPSEDYAMVSPMAKRKRRIGAL